MPQPIQRGSLAERLRQLLRLSGRIPLQLDENVVPIVLTDQVNLPPWRLSPTIFANFNTSAAVAAENSFLGWGVRAGDFGVMVVKRIAVDNLGAATAANISIVRNSLAALLATGTDFSPTERMEQLDPKQVIANVAQPVGIVGPIIGTNPGIVLGVELERQRLQTGANAPTRIVFEGPYVLPAGTAISVWRQVVNEALSAHIYGEFYPDVSSAPPGFGL